MTMQDRFRYRAFITCNICIDVEEEKEISFYIYDVAVYSNGDIGFSRDDLLDALSKLDLTENQKDEIEEEISENSYYNDCEWYSIEFEKKEQCTGLKSKNGKLIYEGDIVKVTRAKNEWTDETSEYIGFIKWFDDMHSLGVETVNKKFNTAFALDPQIFNIEIIGNINENPELLNADNA